MSTQFPMLKQVEVEPLRLQQLHQQLRRQGVDSTLQPLPGVPCLRFQLRGSNGHMICRIQAQDWASHHLPSLQGLDWTSLDPVHLAGLCSTPVPVQWQAPSLEYHEAMFLDLVVADPEDTAHPRVASQQGPVWIEQLNWRWPQTSAPIEVTGSERLPVQMRLGKVRQSVKRLLRLRPGDIVLVPYARPQGWRANRCLFEFVIHPEFLDVTTIYPTEADQPHPDTVMDSEHFHDSLDLANLPLSLEVVLTTLQLSLAELADLTNGSTLNLPEQAYRQVRIEHNGHCVATGELVQVGDVLGVQLAQTPRLT